MLRGPKGFADGWKGQPMNDLRGERWKDSTTVIDYRTLEPCSGHTYELQGQPAHADPMCVECLRLNLIRARRLIDLAEEMREDECARPNYGCNSVQAFDYALEKYRRFAYQHEGKQE